MNGRDAMEREMVAEPSIVSVSFSLAIFAHTNSIIKEKYVCSVDYALALCLFHNTYNVRDFN